MKSPSKKGGALNKFVRFFTNNALLKLFSLALAILLYYAVKPSATLNSAATGGTNREAAVTHTPTLIETILKPAIPVAVVKTEKPAEEKPAEEEKPCDEENKPQTNSVPPVAIAPALEAERGKSAAPQIAPATDSARDLEKNTTDAGRDE